VPAELDVPEEVEDPVDDPVLAWVVPVVPVDTAALGELAELAAWAPVVEVW
jgi:hypothetical protein